MNPQNEALFSSDLWRPALEKYAGVTHTTVKLFDTDLRAVFGPIHPTPLFQMFHEIGYDPGIFAECANRCLSQTENRPAVIVSKVHGLAVIGTSLVLEGKVVGAAVAGYVLLDFSQASEIQGMARDAGVGFERLWQVAREQQPLSHSRLILNGELLQVMGDALLRENSRTRQYQQTVVLLEETASAKDEVHRAVGRLNTVLSEREERYRALFELGPVAVYSCDASGVIDNFNHRAAELWGRAPAPGDTDERFCGSHMLFRPDGSFMPHEECPMADVVSGRITEVRDGEVLIERPDGSRITVIVNIRRLTNRHGEITGAINCFYDITERKEAERARGRLAAIVESSGDAIIGKDLDGIITTWNRGAERLFGYTEQEAIGQPITILIPPERLHEEPGILEAIRRGECIDHFETIRRHKDGTLLEISLTISPVVDDSGRIVGASKIARDITVRKQAEAVLRQSHDDLERMVEERTADLRKLSSNLLRAQDDERRRISRELHDSVGQYLAAAKMSLAALRKPDATEKEAKRFDELMDTLEKCFAETRTISYLLHPPLLDEVGFASAARWYVEGFSKRSDIQVNLKIPDELKRLPGGLELVLFRILQESLTNIHRHSHSQSVDIQLEFVAADVVLRVRDYGQGMPAELVERFRSGAGVGVGLRSMRERIGEMGGRFEIQSDENGTLIKVIAPLFDTATKSALAAAKVSSA